MSTMPLVNVSRVQAALKTNGDLLVVPRHLSTSPVDARDAATVPTGNTALVVLGLLAVLAQTVVLVQPTTTVPVVLTHREVPVLDVVLAPLVTTALGALAAALEHASGVAAVVLANSEQDAPIPPVGPAKRVSFAPVASTATAVVWLSLSTLKEHARLVHLAVLTEVTELDVLVPAPVLAEGAKIVPLRGLSLALTITNAVLLLLSIALVNAAGAQLVKPGITVPNVTTVRLAPAKPVLPASLPTTVPAVAPTPCRLDNAPFVQLAKRVSGDKAAVPGLVSSILENVPHVPAVVLANSVLVALAPIPGHVFPALPAERIPIVLIAVSLLPSLPLEDAHGAVLCLAH